MKRKSLSFVILFLSICSSGISQNYYKGKKTVKADTITYEVSEYEYDEINIDIIGLENASNVLFKDYPYNTEKQRYYTYEELPWLCPPQERFRNVVASILNPENTSYGSKIFIYVAIDPLSAIVEEVKFDIRSKGNAKTLSIPPERFEQLEKRLIGGDFGFTVPDRYNVATYVQGYYLYEF